MRSAHRCLQSFCALALTTLSIFSTSSILHGQILTYQLQPGSTITPVPVGGVTYPSEPLSGTFQWLIVGTEPNGSPLLETASISFSSPSYSIQLTPGTITTTYLDPPPLSDGSLAGLVTLTGLFPSQAIFQAAGYYSGPISAPTSVNFSDNSLLALGVAIVSYDLRGNYSPIADASIVAVLVPEPSTFAILSLAAIGLIASQRFSRKR